MQEYVVTMEEGLNEEKDILVKLKQGAVLERDLHQKFKIVNNDLKKKW